MKRLAFSAAFPLALAAPWRRPPTHTDHSPRAAGEQWRAADMSDHEVGVVVSKLDAIRVAQATGDIPQNVNFAISGPKDECQKSKISQNRLYGNPPQNRRIRLRNDAEFRLALWGHRNALISAPASGAYVWARFIQKISRILDFKGMPTMFTPYVSQSFGVT